METKSKTSKSEAVFSFQNAMSKALEKIAGLKPADIYDNGPGAGKMLSSRILAAAVLGAVEDGHTTIDLASEAKAIKAAGFDPYQPIVNPFAFLFADGDEDEDEDEDEAS